MCVMSLKAVNDSHIAITHSGSLREHCKRDLKYRPAKNLGTYPKARIEAGPNESDIHSDVFAQ